MRRWRCRRGCVAAPTVCVTKGKISVEARIGVNTGEVVVRTVETGGNTEYTPVGHVTNWRHECRPRRRRTLEAIKRIILRESALAAFRRAKSEFSDDPEVEVYIDQTIPVLEAHLKMARNLHHNDKVMRSRENAANNKKSV
jgi:hypothetical protein